MHGVAEDISIYPRVFLGRQSKLLACQAAFPRWLRLPEDPKACVVGDTPSKVLVHFPSLLAVISPIIHLSVEVYWYSARELCNQLND